VWDEYWKVSWLWEKVVRKIMSEALFYIIKEEAGELRGKKLIELGCGTGLISAKLAEFGADVTVVDQSREALRLAKKNFKVLGCKGKFLRTDVFDLDGKKSREYDIVFSEGLVEHFYKEKRQKIFDLHSNLAKDGGTVFIAIPNKHSFARNLFRQVVRCSVRKKIWIDIPQLDLTAQELCARMEKAGLKVLEIRGILFPFTATALFYFVGFFYLVPFLVYAFLLGNKSLIIDEMKIPKYTTNHFLKFECAKNVFNRTLGYELIAIGKK
jgi:2-polyprenyl-3-methyl-5-hydroxy-6-metoxy-1,4-benzoquinol methylase